ncbi:DNA polymerase Y family protein [Vibrio sp. JC009]|uniref:Y-family DNA polymerase n=1 Tax=Vibrio sp. JC009 TaxID=2912314 RepID=UPI0023AF047E|nr:DNA polymerase Y family protein [Vibrio sp. JC009]WED23274.1 DNA polymerase Y family protein [Vibrio sp. JC009]
MLWLYLHFPRLQLDTLFSDIREVPLCIMDKHTIIQVNDIAEKAGIKTGMGLGSAASLCNNLQVHPYKAGVEESKLKEIAHWLYLVTSDISLFPPDGLLLKVSNMLTLYDGLESYWRSLKKQLDELNLNYHYSTAFSPLAARLLAKAGEHCISDSRNWLEQKLLTYPVQATELPGKQIEKLNRVGIRHLKDLLTIDISEVAKRFDIELVNYTGRLTGRFKHPVDFYYPPETFKRYLELLYEIENIQWLEKPLYKLFVQLESFLKLREQVAYELTLRLHLRDKADQEIIFHSANGDYQADKWNKLSQLALESVKLEAPVIGMTLLASQVDQLQPDGKDFFDGQTGNRSALELISLLQAKLGKEAVKGIALTDDPRPEKATQLCEPMYESQNSQDRRPLRPSLLLPKPEPLQEKVTIMQGPERLSTGWWDGGGIIRDYFIAVSPGGRWVWVFRDKEGGWFLHGFFS